MSAPKPATLAHRERQAPARSRTWAHQLPELPPAPPAVLVAPELRIEGDRITVLGVELGTDQARALWAQLGTALGEAQRHRRPKAWRDLQAWLDRAFQPGIRVSYREASTKVRGEGLAVLDGDGRAMVRVGIFQVAHLKRRRSGKYTGAIADYWPGPLGTGANCPDPGLAFTARRILVSGDALAAAVQAK